MRVAFDFDTIAINKFSGLYAYGRELLKGFSKLAADINAKLVYSKHVSEEVGRLKADHPDRVLLRPMPVKRRRLEKLWRHIGYPPLQWLIGNFDLYHCLYNFMPPTAGKPRIMTVHDLRWYKCDLYTKTKHRRYEFAVKQADHFIAVSQSTKNDLCEIFGIPHDKVDITYLAADEHLSPLSENGKKQLKTKFSEQMKTSLDRFVIAVSSYDSRKNIERTVRAFRMIAKQLPKGMKMVVAGIPPNNSGDRQQQETYPDNDVIWTGPVDNLTEWMACADALAYASLYEGFGIPILEAFASGVPVITSNCTSMPEVAGDAAILVNPYDERSIAEAIVNTCNDNVLHQRLIRSGLERSKQFSWTKTAAKTLEVYRKML
jgi:glycosyltransferase involved in cell wall biosynthesis